MLLFKQKFLPAIRSGEKTQTIRLWPFRRMKPGQRSYIPGAGYIRILAVDEIVLSELRDEDARPDGFATAEALQTELNNLYAQQLAAGQQAYRLRFELLSPAEQAEAIAARGQRTARTRPPGESAPQPGQNAENP
jgi:hypothetical protein